jgi:hypothetical protein
MIMMFLKVLVRKSLLDRVDQFPNRGLAQCLILSKINYFPDCYKKIIYKNSFWKIHLNKKNLIKKVYLTGQTQVGMKQKKSPILNKLIKQKKISQ